MTREEMKKKIYEMVLAELQNQFGCGDAVETGDREVCAEAVADALIAAGIGDISAMLEYLKSASKNAEEQRKNLIEIQNTQLDDLNNLRKYAEHRAEVAERALDLCETAYILALNGKQHEGISQQAIMSDLGVHKFFMEQAGKELEEEAK